MNILNANGSGTGNERAYSYVHLRSQAGYFVTDSGDDTPQSKPEN